MPKGLGTVQQLRDELLEYVDILKGHADAPIQSPYLALMEVATAYLARAMEIDMLILLAEAQGPIPRELYKFRTGPLDRFQTIARRMADLGSRRLTAEQMVAEERRTSSR